MVVGGVAGVLCVVGVAGLAKGFTLREIEGSEDAILNFACFLTGHVFSLGLLFTADWGSELNNSFSLFSY